MPDEKETPEPNSAENAATYALVEELGCRAWSGGCELVGYARWDRCRCLAAVRAVAAALNGTADNG
jgi:hypothetical protein